MGKFERLFIVFFVLAFFGLPLATQAQNEDDSEFFIYESLNDSVDLRCNFYDTYDSLSLFFPGSDIYENWDNENIHYPKIDFSKKEDTTMLILCDDKTSFFCMPRNGKVNSEYGYRHRRFHYGTDIDLDVGDSVRCAFDGMVRVARYHKGYGNVIVVRHFNGIETTYAHLSVSKVIENQIIKAGDLIGFGGNSGRSTGPHLHFETRYLGTPFNPRKIIDFDKKKLISDTLLVSKYLFQNKAGARPSTTTQTTYKSTTQTTTSAKTGATYYTVKKGDTLSQIAAKYKTNVAAICKLSGITSKSVLKIGQKLRVK